ncbi:hypothetical protein [uncultured Methylobacterium sp.]|jgi:hypothetical protein|uniref:hypothetical protein n=1 Tax=uncultured Methylobacterium sp. TaxID=157278 RepID=UPI00260A12C7|nr:hypothetical protein [uncultured Methylobacterium sp.]
MTRNRARPSFTVEIKRNRPAPVLAAGDADHVPSEPVKRGTGRSLWEGTSLFEEVAAAESSGRFDAEPLPEPVAAKAPSPVAAQPRRVLPSLIAPPEPPAPEPIEVHREERLPPVRRPQAIEKKTKPAPRPARTAFVWPEDWPDEPVVAAPPPPAPAPRPIEPQEDVSAATPGEARSRPPRRRDADLHAGQRWKRRLPRVCW